MKRFIQKTRLMAAAVIAFAASGFGAMAQTPVGTDVDSRVLIGLSVDPAAVQARMPEGWSAVPFPSGPMKGANLLMGFEDRAIALDAEGKPKSPSSAMAVAVLGLGKKTDGDEVRLYVLRVYSTAPELLPYGNAVAAGITRKTSREDATDGSQARTDHWTAVTPDGRIELALGFTTGRRGWAPSKAKLFSNADPSVVRILDYQQLVDVLQSDGMGKPMSGTAALTGDLAEMADLMGDGMKVMAILDIPVYVRTVLAP